MPWQMSWFFKLKKSNTPEENYSAITGLINHVQDPIFLLEAKDNSRVKAIRDAVAEEIQNTFKKHNLGDISQLLLVVMQVKLYIEEKKPKGKKRDTELIACDELVLELAARLAISMGNKTFPEFIDKRNQFIESFKTKASEIAFTNAKLPTLLALKDSFSHISALIEIYKNKLSEGLQSTEEHPFGVVQNDKLLARVTKIETVLASVNALTIIVTKKIAEIKQDNIITEDEMSQLDDRLKALNKEIHSIFENTSNNPEEKALLEKIKREYGFSSEGQTLLYYSGLKLFQKSHPKPDETNLTKTSTQTPTKNW